MPHLITSRQRLYSPGQQGSGHSSQYRWETVNVLTYKLGGVCFVVGSLLFFPALSDYQRIGAWLFFLGSLCYLLVTAHDLWEARHYWRKHRTKTQARHIELTAAYSYVIASVLFAAGSLFFLPWWGWEKAGAWCFILGSVLFVIGGCANLLQLVEAPSKLYMQLYNFTLATFLIGSVLFTVATVPYLMQFQNHHDHHGIYRLAAGEFTFASLLFLLGGIFIYWRTFAQKKLEQQEKPSRFGQNFILSIRHEIKEESR